MEILQFFTEFYVMPNKRSPRGRIKQAIRRYIFTTSYRDHNRAETVCRIDRKQILDYILSYTDHIILSDIPEIEKGLVLTDSRGNGYFQKIPVRR